MIMVMAGLLISLAGCGAEADSDQPRPAQQGVSAVSPIPQVDNPRDVAVMANRTCELLTTQQAAGFGLDLPPLQLEGLFGTVSCEWKNSGRDRRVAISVFTNNPTLEAAYSQRQGRPFLELTDIAGYPTIATRSDADLPVCSILVKPAERQSFTVTYDADEFDKNPQQACGVGKQVAETVLMNLPVKG